MARAGTSKIDVQYPHLRRLGLSDSLRFLDRVDLPLRTFMIPRGAG